ncbi:restriction endonuclease subunit S [Leptothrix ochracea]|uniref:restriction endonuclease subunit S n=1 Tax=Leptothrix ochracea TaxID=735331 RepID=UPI0034E2F49F
MREGWVEKSIADCLELAFAGEWGEDPNPANAQVLRATDIDDDGHVVGVGAARSIPPSKLRAKLLRHEDILLEGSGGGPGKPVGRVARFDGAAHGSAAVCSNFFKTLRPDQSVVNPSFLWRKLDWFYRQPELLALQQQTTGIINLKFAEYLEARISIPRDRGEQAEVARVLDTLDTTIRQTEAIIEKLKQVKQGLLHDLLTRGIDANGELRPPQSQAPELYKESVLGWIPREWEVELLDEVAVRGSGHTPSKSVASYWNGGVKWVSLADSHRLDQIHIDTTDKEISELGIANSSAVKHPGGTVILSRDAGVGKSAVLAAEMAVSQHFMAWRCGVRLNNLYLYFRFQHMKPMFETIALGSTVKTIGLDYFKKLRIAVPERDEQDRAVEIMMDAELNIRRHQSEFDKLRLLKSGLMDDLLTGRVRVTPLLA